MKTWLVTIGETIPLGEGQGDRLHRTGYFAHFLANRGHEVVWWTSTFDHFRKQHWFAQDHLWQVTNNLKIHLLHGCGYRSNISIKRFRDHGQLGRKFAERARQEKIRPDIILAALPTIELCREGVRYGQEHGIPVVLDMRDMWPDIFVDHAPGPLRWLARLLLKPLFQQARAACAGATCITGITEPFVEWGLNRGGRKRTELDRAFPLGYISQVPTADRIREAEQIWNEQGVPLNGNDRLACFVGTLGRQFDLETVIQAARVLAAESQPDKGDRPREAKGGCPLGRTPAWRFVICGTGDRQEHYQRLAAGLPNMMFPGWVDAALIHVLMRRSAVGLDPLPDRYDFLATINNKAIEYLSAGLPIVACPKTGVLANLLARERCGMCYPHKNAEELVNIFQTLGNDRGGLREMSANAGRVFQEQFTAEKVYGNMMAYLEEIVLKFPKQKEVL